MKSRYERSFHPVLIDGDFFGRLAVTPLTLAIDIVFGPQVGDFLSWLTGKSPGGDRPQRRN